MKDEKLKDDISMLSNLQYFNATLTGHFMKMCLDTLLIGGAHNPQWASVSYGIWICLECSGKHRGLGNR